MRKGVQKNKEGGSDDNTSNCSYQQTNISSRLHQDGTRTINVGPMERLISIAGGGALTYYGLRHLSLRGALFALLGGDLVYRGITGHCWLYQVLGVSTAEKLRSTLVRLPDNQGIKVKRTVTINRPAEDLYRFWEDVENMPRFMKYIQEVSRTGENRSHWVAQSAVLGTRLEWDSEVTHSQAPSLIAWRTLNQTSFAHAGTVRFGPTPYGNETTVTLTLEFRQPVGQVGAITEKLLGYIPEQLALEDLRRFKQLMEAAEIAQSESHPSGRSTM
ncbi:MAG: DUF2892 domain-containing protein [Chloroflexi bacterium]|nr:MAG: DUF2892 domain-containing protein [Chloroflexota bacterium]